MVINSSSGQYWYGGFLMAGGSPIVRCLSFFFNGNSESKVDENWGYLYFKGNPHTYIYIYVYIIYNMTYIYIYTRMYMYMYMYM